MFQRLLSIILNKWGYKKKYGILGIISLVIILIISYFTRFHALSNNIMFNNFFNILQVLTYPVSIAGIFSIIFAAAQYKREDFKLTMDTINKYYHIIQPEINKAEDDFANLKYYHNVKQQLFHNLQENFPNIDKSTLKEFVDSDENMKNLIKKQVEFYCTKHAFNELEIWLVPIVNNRVDDELIIKETPGELQDFLFNHKIVLSYIKERDEPFKSCRKIYNKWHLQ